MPPVNDNVADAVVITGDSGTVTGSNVGATLETDETFLGNRGDDNSSTVWWAWTAPADGQYEFNTFGSALGSESLDTILEIWNVDGATDLSDFEDYTLVIYNDDADDSPDPDNSTSGGTTSKVIATVFSGTAYYIRIYGYDSTQNGDIVLNWLPYISPDNFAGAIEMVGTDDGATVSASASDNLTDYTLEIGEPDVDSTGTGVTGVNTGWAKWTAPHSGSASFLAVSSDLHLVFDVWTGTAVDDLTLIGAVDQPGGGGGGSVTFLAASGTTYYLRVNSYDDTIGPGDYSMYVTLSYGSIIDGGGSSTITFTDSFKGDVHSRPANDDVADAIVLTGTAGSYSPFSTIASTLEDDEEVLPSTASAPGSVWFSWNPAGFIGVATFSTSVGTGLEVLVAGGTTAGSGNGSVSFNTRDGETYLIRAFPVGDETDGLAIHWSTTINTLPLTLITTVMDTSPGTLQASIYTDEANGVVQLYLDGSGVSFQEVDLDDGGDAINFTILVPAVTAGGHTIRAVLDTGAEASVAFSVIMSGPDDQGDGSLPDDDPDYPPFAPPPTDKWRLTDPTDGSHWDFPFNPSQVDSPTLPRVLTATATSAPAGGKPVVYEGGRPAKVWTFSGDLFHAADEVALKAWDKKPWRVLITDDFGRTFMVLVAQVQTTPVRDVEWPDHVSYKVTTYFFGMLFPPAVSGQPAASTFPIKPQSAVQYPDAGQGVVTP